MLSLILSCRQDNIVVKLSYEHHIENTFVVSLKMPPEIKLVTAAEFIL